MIARLLHQRQLHQPQRRQRDNAIARGRAAASTMRTSGVNQVAPHEDASACATCAAASSSPSSIAVDSDYEYERIDATGANTRGQLRLPPTDRQIRYAWVLGKALGINTQDMNKILASTSFSTLVTASATLSNMDHDAKQLQNEQQVPSLTTSSNDRYMKYMGKTHDS